MHIAVFPEEKAMITFKLKLIGVHGNIPDYSSSVYD